MEPARVQLDLPARIESLREVHAALAEATAVLPPGAADDLALLTVELVTNAVRHSGTAPDGRVQLDVVPQPGTMRVEVRDGGGGFDADPSAPGQRQTGGRGMFLVDQLADRWGLERDPEGFLVWAELWTGGRTRHRRVPPRMPPVGGHLQEAADEPRAPGRPELAALSDAALKDELNLLAEDERTTSTRRRQLHARIDGLRREVERRLTGPRDDDVLSAEDLREVARMLSDRMPASQARRGGR